MKLVSTIRVVLAASVLASSGAFASIAAPTASGGTTLFLIADNGAAGSTFIATLGTSTGSVWTGSTTASNSSQAPVTGANSGFAASPTLSLSAGAASALETFATAAGANFEWTIMGATEVSAGPTDGTQNSGVYVSLVPSLPATPVANLDLVNQNSGLLSTLIGDLNTALNGSDFVSGASNLYSTYANGNASTWGSGAPYTNASLNKTGGALNLYAYAISAAAGGNANLYKSGFTVALNTSGVTAATLTVTPSSVPLPAAVWLLGSGLLGLMGVGRRRNATAA